VEVHLLLQVSPDVYPLQVASVVHPIGVYVAADVVVTQSPTPVIVLQVLQYPELQGYVVVEVLAFLHKFWPLLQSLV